MPKFRGSRRSRTSFLQIEPNGWKFGTGTTNSASDPNPDGMMDTP